MPAPVIRAITRLQDADDVDPAESADTLGSVTGRYAVYDSAGDLLGYLPIYDTITLSSLVGHSIGLLLAITYGE